MRNQANIAADDPLAELIKARPVHDSILSNSCLDMMRCWLRNCDDKHKHCLEILDRQLPTRIINVGTGSVAPRLVIFNGQYGQ
jgi:hypothetical protein